MFFLAIVGPGWLAVQAGERINDWFMLGFVGTDWLRQMVAYAISGFSIGAIYLIAVFAVFSLMDETPLGRVMKKLERKDERVED